MAQLLSNICDYINEKIAVNELSDKNYISTENMLPNKSGIVKASTLPNMQLTPAYQENDVLISNIRPYFKKIWQAEYYGGCSNDVLVLRAKQFVNPKFLYYVLSEDKFFDYATATSKGTKMPRGDKSAIMKYGVPEFSEIEQEKIANILFPIDKKIAINSATNNNLEQQAQAIFKSWFVDFEPFGGTMPKIWKNGTIEDLSQNIICGKTPSTSKKEYYGNDIPFITIPDMHNNTYVTKTERYLSRLGASSQKNKILPPNSICVSCIATAGLVSITAFYSQTNQQINSIIPAQEMSSYYIYLLLKSLSKKIIMLGSSGSTTCNLNKGQFAKIEVIIPDKNVLKKYDEIVSPLFESIKNNQLENEQLAQLRDTLLPKLMNGEIDVSKVDIDDILTNQSADKLLFSILVFEHLYIKIVILIGVTINTMTIFTSNIIKFKLKKSFTFDN